MPEKEVDPASASLDGNWQLTKISVYVVPKGGKKVEGSDAGNNVFVTLSKDRKVTGQLPFITTSSDSFLYFDIEDENYDYRYEVSGDEIILMNRAGNKDIERSYFKLSRTGKSMTWTMSMDLARKSISETLASIIVPFDKEDLDDFDDFQMKYDFVKK